MITPCINIRPVFDRFQHAKQAIKNWMVGRSGNEARVKTHGGLVNRKFKLNVGKKIIDVIKRTILGTIKHSKLRLQCFITKVYLIYIFSWEAC